MVHGMDSNLTPGGGFRSRLMSEISREEDLQDWFRSTQGQIVLGLAGSVFIVVALWRGFFG